MSKHPKLQMDMTMNKKLLALAVSGAVFGTQAVAVELYNEDGTTFSEVGGHVSVAVGDVNSGDRISNDDAFSRLKLYLHVSTSTQLTI